VKLVAPLNTKDNAAQFPDNFEGTCGGTQAGFRTWVTGATQSDAIAKCSSIAGQSIADNLADGGYPVPADWWFCQ
jgi:hypothetical protein